MIEEKMKAIEIAIPLRYVWHQHNPRISKKIIKQKSRITWKISRGKAYQK